MNKIVPKKRIAIVGGGITGVAAAHFLQNQYEVILFEKNQTLGGNIDTHLVHDTTGKEIAIDTGFISFNTPYYPEFLNFLKTLDIEIGQSDMTYGIDNRALDYQACGKSFIEAMVNTKSKFSFCYWRLTFEGRRFEKITTRNNHNFKASLTVEGFAKEFKFSNFFRNHYLYPVAAGLMSQSVKEIKKFPFIRILNYYRNHHLCSFKPEHPHLYVKNGYQRYLEAAVKPPSIEVKVGTPVAKVHRINQSVEVHTQQQTYNFDAVVMACEADIAFKLIENPSPLEQEILGVFTYKINTGYLHQDTSIMPASKKQWATHTSHVSADESQGCHSIWLNKILQLPTKDPYLMTLNPFFEVKPDTIIAPLKYRHLRVTTEVIRAQRKLHRLNQSGPVYYAGSYYKYFHEDAVKSALAVSQRIKQTI